MKTSKLILLFFILYKFNLFSETAMTWEIGINVYNTDYMANKEFRLTALSTVWDKSYRITDVYNFASGMTSISGVCGFDIFDDNSGTNRSISIGLYELRSISSSNQKVMYLDLRDCGVANNWSHTVGSLDFDIMFNWSDQQFEYNNINYNNRTLCIWDIFKKQPCVNYLQPTIPKNIFLSHYNGCPIINWDLSEPATTASYDIYREISSAPGYSLVASLPAGTVQWIDNNFNTGGASARYKIRAISGDGNLQSPDFSAIIETDIKPTTPSNLHCENNNGRPHLIWNLSEPPAAATYEVWRRVSSNPPKYLVVVED